MKYTILLSICILAFSCNQNASDDNTQSNNQQIIPLKIANHWVLEWSNERSTNLKDTLNISVSGKYTIGGVDWYQYSIISAQNRNGELLRAIITGEDESENIYNSNQQGGYFFGYYNSTNKPSEVFTNILWLYPAKQDDIYIVRTSQASNGAKVKVANINKQVTVPSGTFSCYEYEVFESDNSTVEYRAFFCPNVGLIKFEENRPSGEMLQLLSYQLR